MPDADYPAPAYHLLNLNFVSSEIRAELLKNTQAFRTRGFQYLVVEYPETDSIKPDLLPFVAEARLIQHIGPWKYPRAYAVDGSGKISLFSVASLFALDRFGLFVDIYEL